MERERCPKWIPALQVRIDVLEGSLADQFDDYACNDVPPRVMRMSHGTDN